MTSFVLVVFRSRLLSAGVEPDDRAPLFSESDYCPQPCLHHGPLCVGSPGLGDRCVCDPLQWRLEGQDGGAVVCGDGEGARAEHTALWSTCGWSGPVTSLLTTGGLRESLIHQHSGVGGP